MLKALGSKLKLRKKQRRSGENVEQQQQQQHHLENKLDPISISKESLHLPPFYYEEETQNRQQNDLQRVGGNRDAPLKTR